MELEEWLADAVSERFKEDDCVSPPNLRKGVFSVGALDNLDHNPSSMTSTSSFHGTGISIFQLPTQNNSGQSRAPLIVPPSGNERHSLPEQYSIVPPTALDTTSVSVPECKMISPQSTLNVAAQLIQCKLKFVPFHQFQPIGYQTVNIDTGSPIGDF